MDAPHDNVYPRRDIKVALASNSGTAAEESIMIQKEMINSGIEVIEEDFKVDAEAPQSQKNTTTVAGDALLAGVGSRRVPQAMHKFQSESNVLNQNGCAGDLDESISRHSLPATMNTMSTHSPPTAAARQVPPAMLMSKQMSTRKKKGIRKKARNPEKLRRPSYIATSGEQPSEFFNESFNHWGSPEAAAHNPAIQESSRPEKHADREYVSIHDDVYNLFFLSRVGGDAFWYSLYVFGLKLALYTFLAIDAFQNDSLDQKTSFRVLCAQFLMLPVAVAMQDDLIATFYLIANIKYCPSVRHTNPEAYEWKFNVGTACRAIDGAYSLCVNFVVLVSATEVLSLFLNFAALQFLQTIDNIALELAADGYLTERLEDVAGNVKEAELPKRSDDNWLRCLDTILFVTTCIILFAFWLMFIIHIQVEAE